MILASFHVAHRSRGAGSHLIRLAHPGSWATHSSGFYAPVNATEDEILNAKLFESRANIGVTGPRLWELGIEGRDGGKAPDPRTRTLRQAIEGGDQVEVYCWHASPEKVLEALDWEIDQQGKKYDMPVKVFLPLTIFRKSALEAQRERKYDREWWCSEYRFAQTLRLGIAALQNIVPFQVTPENLRWSPVQSFVIGWPDNFQHIEKTEK